ncbi:MAG: NAD-binding protein, partial [Burkholderiaceae bacterium]
QQAGRIALRFSGAEWLQRSLQLQRIAARSLEQERHVIICGYGRCGQALAHVLETEQVPYIALDLDPDRVRQAAGSGETVVYGDSTRRDTLQAAGLHRARALVVTFDDTPTAMRVLHVLRQHAPALPVLVRTSHESDIERLREAGATEVVPEIVEGSLMLASHVMLLADVPLARVQRRVAQVREGRYALLSGFFPGLDDRSREQIERAETHLRSIEIRPGSALVGRPLTDLPLEGARVKVVVRRGRRFADPGGELLLEDGDLLVVSGTLEQLGGTEARIASFR